MSSDEPLGGSPQPPPPPPPLEPSGPETQEPLPSLPARLVGVLASPGATFRSVTGRPVWAGALVVYLVFVGLATVVYSMNVDWEAMVRNQFETSIFFKFFTSFADESQMAEFERASLNEILSLGRGGMALRTTIQQVFGAVIFFHFMLILFCTLFYLMGALGDLKLGRVYLDGLLCLLVLILSAILGAVIRGAMGADGRAALPYQAGLSTIFFIAYFWIFYRSMQRQPDLKRMAASYAHAMAVPMVGAIVLMVITLLKSEPLTVPGDQVVTSSLGAILGMGGNGALGTLLGALDLFTLWGLYVAAVGFTAASRLSFGTAAAITFLPWGFWTMVRVAGAATFGG